MEVVMIRAVVATTLVFFAGCVVPMAPIKSTDLGRERTVEKNYTTGVEKRTAVGESMIRVKDYIVQRWSTDVLRPNVDFEISQPGILGPTLLGAFSRHQFYKITGGRGEMPRESRRIHGKTRGRTAGIVDRSTQGNEDSGQDLPAAPMRYYLLPMRRGTSWVWVDSSSGEISKVTVGEANTRDPTNLPLEVEIEPADARFENILREDVDTKPGYTNYEIVYTGNDGESMFLTYREFSPKDMARTAFFQDLRYDLSSKRIRFKDTVIEVQEVDNESILFRVVADGTGEPLAN